MIKFSQRLNSISEYYFSSKLREVKSLVDSGKDIINLGILPTPVNYFSMFHLDLSASVQVTGSHNPPEYNGFKFMRGKTYRFTANGISNVHPFKIYQDL